jgi:hypothetical protein
MVAGALANKPRNGGEAWVRLSWALGIARLGFDVIFVEQIAAADCRDDAGATVAFRDSLNVAYFRAVTNAFGLCGRAVLIRDDGPETEGLTYAELLDLAANAALLINISGHLALDSLTRLPRCRVYVDIDPGFTQYWHAQGVTGARLAGHDFYYTIGENVGCSGCRIPSVGVSWRHTRQPVVLDDWPATSTGWTQRFTTVANWRGPYGRIEHGGKAYGLKVHEFRKFLDLPRRAPGVFEIALNIHPADGGDLDALRDHGWTVVDPVGASADPDAFRRYVQGSGAEFSVAQGIYVETESGWFSDRTVRYLASGRPALVQDTGFSRTLPVGTGLLPFRTLDDAVAGAERIAADYDAHARGARALAEEYFDSDVVLGRLVEEIGVGP